METRPIKNFCIIAHIDHGKSTLSDRIIEYTHAIPQREMHNQILDTMDLEQERGITIKLQTLRMYYTAKDHREYEFNLIDTPGHADFNYEVSRSIAACEGSILVVDATQGIQAQTIANLKLALDEGLTILPVINKIDMPNASPEKVKEELMQLKVPNAQDALFLSAKTGEGVSELLERIAAKIPSPKGCDDAPLQALVFDSHYDSFKGVVLHIRVVNGCIHANQSFCLLASGKTFVPAEIGVFTPAMFTCETLNSGMVGYISTGLKDASILRPGDTLVSAAKKADPLPGYEPAKQMVFAGFFPLDSKDEIKLKDAIHKLSLNDSSFSFTEEHSAALGNGFRCGFMGILHMEIIQERLEREYEIPLLTTAPSVPYQLHLKSGETVIVRSPKDYPDFPYIETAYEPMVKATLIIPAESVGNVMELCTDKKGNYCEMTYLSQDRVELIYHFPASFIVYDFYDKLKSLTHGYSSVSYEDAGYQAADLVKLDIYLNDDLVDAFSCIVHRENAYEIGHQIVEKMKYVIPRKLYPMPVQAVVEHKALAREDIPPLRKSATGKGFSGSASQKKKAAKNISQNASRQRKFGKADIPQEALFAILSLTT